MHVLFCASTDLKDAKYIRKGRKNLLETKFGICDTLGMCGKVVDCNRTKFGVMLTLNDGENFVVTAGTFNKNALQDAEDVLKKFNEGNREIYLLVYPNPFYKDTIYLNANQDYSVIEVTKQTYEKFHEIRKKGQAYLMKKFNKNIVEKEKAKMQKEEKEIKEQREERGTKEETKETERQKEETKVKEEGKEKGIKEQGKEKGRKEIMEEKEEWEEKETMKEKEEVFGYSEYEYSEYGIEPLMSEAEYKMQRKINLTIVEFIEDLAKKEKDNIIKIEKVVNELKKSEKFSSLDINWIDKIYELLEMGYFYEPKPGYIKPVT